MNTESPPIVCCTGSPGDKDIQLLHDRQFLLEKETDWKKNSYSCFGFQESRSPKPLLTGRSSHIKHSHVCPSLFQSKLYVVTVSKSKIVNTFPKDTVGSEGAIEVLCLGISNHHS